MIHFLVSIDPVAKARARVTRFHAYTPTNTKRFEQEFLKLALVHKPRSPLVDPLEVEIVFQIKKPKSSKNDLPIVRPDLDNYVKAVCDAMNGVFWNDDSQIVNLTARKRYGDFGCVEVSINPRHAKAAVPPLNGDVVGSCTATCLTCGRPISEISK